MVKFLREMEILMETDSAGIAVLFQQNSQSWFLNQNVKYRVELTL